MKQKDLVVYYPFYGGGKYQPMPHTLPGAGSYSDAKELFDFLKKCSLTEKECIERCENLNAENNNNMKETKMQDVHIATRLITDENGKLNFSFSLDDIVDEDGNKIFNSGDDVVVTICPTKKYFELYKTQRL